MSVFDSIIEWAKSQKPIVKEVFLRVIKNNGFSEEDVKCIVALLKKEIGIDENGSDEIAYSDFPINSNLSSKEAGTLILKRIQKIRSVTTIKDETVVPFSHKGLTIIYGENGAGKSGIARVLKQACRARQVERVLSNVYQPSSEEPVAEVVVNLNGDDFAIPWTNGQHSIGVLSNISVFDSKCALVQLDKGKNELFFIPHGGDIFKEMVGCFSEVKRTLVAEKKQLRLPQLSRHYSSETDLSKLLAQIDRINSSSEFEEIVVWTDADLAELQRCHQLKASANEVENKKRQAQINQKLTKISQLENILNVATTVFSVEKIRSFNGLVSDLKSKRDAIDLFSKELSSSVILDQVGGDVWRELYTAAKKYSIQCLHEHDFPKADEGAVCVFCQQPIGREASGRMKAFASLMEGGLKRNFDESEKSLVNARKFVRENLLDSNVQAANIFLDLKAEYVDLVEGELEKIKKLAERLIDTVEPMSEEEINSLSFTSSNLQGLEKKREDAQFVLEEIKQILLPEKMTSLDSQIEVLEQKQEVFGKRSEYLSYISDLLNNKKIDECIKQTETTLISKSGNKIVSSHIGGVFAKNLMTEIGELGEKKLPLKLKMTGDAGVINFDVGLENVTLPRLAKTSDILSEGEVKVMSLAVFLAEVRINSDRYPIVLDDPVTSLDHKYREKIAERLVKEGAERQVVIFTHDIAFVSMLEKRCQEYQTALHLISIRNDSGHGEVSSETPWHAKKVAERIKVLRGQVVKLRELGTTPDQELYNRKAGEIFGLLREVWERFVEEIVFNRTISRFGYDVKTQSLGGVLVTDEDYTTIYWGMAKCSRWMIGHDDSETLDVARPLPDEISNEIDKFDSYFQSCKKSRNELEAKRKKLTNSTPSSTVG